MTKYFLLITLTLLAACVPTTYVPTVTSWVVYGDSNCTLDGAWPQLLGIEQKCVWGQRLLDRHELAVGREGVILQYGTNDGLQHVPVIDFEAHLVQLLTTTDSPVYCILPDNQRAQFAPYREVLEAHCPNTMEPREHGFKFLAIDGIHGLPSDHHAFAASLKELLEL